MELLILAGLGAAGYHLNKKGKETRYDHTELARPASQGPLEKEDLGVYEKRFVQSMDPVETGIIPPGYNASSLIKPTDLRDSTGRPVMPFFSSERKQHTSTNLKQTRMELFTGAIYEDQSQTGYYRRKEERAPLFRPEEVRQKVTFSGTTGNQIYNAENREDRFVLPNKKHHMTPTEQIRVGPGINTPVDVPASGGFHTYTRILPKNIGEYSKNNLPGRSGAGGAGGVPGSSLIGTSTATTQREALSLGPAPGRAALTAPAIREEASAPKVARPEGSQHFGVAGAAAASKPPPLVSPTNLKDDATTATMLTNVAATRAGVGAYTAANITPRPTDREQATGLASGAKGAPGTYVQTTPLLGQTNRSATGPGPAPLPTPAVAAPGARTAVAPTTHRQQLAPSTYVGIAGSAAKPAAVPAGQNVDLGRLRRDSTLYSYTPGVQKINNFTRELGAVTTSSTLKEVPPRAPAPATVNVGGRATPIVEQRHAVPVENPRLLDAALLAKQRETSPYNISLD
jgi:hypothetical protein